MKPFVVGTREDVAGFALAGVRGVVCSTREEVAAAVARVDDDTLVIMSGQFAGAPHPSLRCAQGYLLPVRGEKGDAGKA